MFLSFLSCLLFSFRGCYIIVVGEELARLIDRDDLLVMFQDFQTNAKWWDRLSKLGVKLHTPYFSAEVIHSDVFFEYFYMHMCHIYSPPFIIVITIIIVIIIIIIIVIICH